jgi:hypothetical protein
VLRCAALTQCGLGQGSLPGDLFRTPATLLRSIGCFGDDVSRMRSLFFHVILARNSAQLYLQSLIRNFSRKNLCYVVAAW